MPFRVVDKNIGLDVDIAVRCNGEYSYRLTDPLLFYKNVCGNVEDVFTRDQIDSQLKSELLTALQPAFAKISEMGIRYSAVPGHTMELSHALNEVLSGSWANTRGIKVEAFGVNTIAASPEDEAMIKELQKAAVMRDPTMAAAQSDAMRAAAANEGGAMAGFMGMGLTGMAGGMNAGNLFQMGASQQPAGAAPSSPSPPSNATPDTAAKADGMTASAATSGWTCSCGAANTGKFCMECGKPHP